MEGRGAVCTRWTGAVALRGSERAKGGREQREWGSNCAHKVLGLLANSQTYTLGSIPLSNVDSSSFRRNRKISILWRASLSNLDRTDLYLIDKNQIHNRRWSFFFFFFISWKIKVWNQIPIFVSFLFDWRWDLKFCIGFNDIFDWIR